MTDYSMLSSRRPRQLKNLRIDDVSSVDVGAGIGCDVVLHKRAPDHLASRREYERLEKAAGRAVPVWQPPEFYKQEEKTMADPVSGIAAITEKVRKCEVGADIAESMAQPLLQQMFSLEKRHLDGRPMSEASQVADFLGRHPVGKSYSSTIAQARAKGVLSSESERKAFYGSEPVTKAAAASPAPTMGSVINNQLDTMAKELLAKARRDKMPLTYEGAYSWIATKTLLGRELVALEKTHRLGSAF